MAMEAESGQLALRDVLSQILKAAKADDNRRAIELASAALEQGLQHPMLYNVRGTGFWHRGLYSEALSDFESARAYVPRNPVLWSAIGNCLLKLARWSEAVTAFDSAIDLAPKIAPAHYQKAVALQMLGDRERAKTALRKALEIKPDFADALGSMALFSFGEGLLEDARDYAGRALASEPGQAAGLIALALSDLKEDRNSAAEEKVRELLHCATFGDDPHANNMLGIVADTLDSRGNVSLAFETYTALHKKRRAIHSARFAGRLAADDVKLLTDYFRKSHPWTAAPDGQRLPAHPAEHVFILGFARSGTTLLETILATNDRVAVLDERDCFPAALRELLRSHAGLDRLSNLGADELAESREAYWHAVRNNGVNVAGKVFVDKWPLNSYRLPLIAKLFPNAKILFALRDPRDVVLSCFCKRFAPNPDTFEFLLLEDCARFYAGVMGLVSEYRRKLPVRIHEHRYEDMIADFETRVRAVCVFIGIGWYPRMRDFSGSVENNIDQMAQSRQQLRQGLYAKGIGQWHRFKNELAPVLPVLQPWVDRFGYPPN